MLRTATAAAVRPVSLIEHVAEAAARGRNTALMLLSMDGDYGASREEGGSLVESCHAEAGRQARSADGLGASAQGPDQLADAVAGRCAVLSADLAGSFRLPSREASPSLLRYLALQAVPSGLSGGAVLQNFSHAGNCHEPARTLMHRVHAWHVGEGALERNHAALFRQLLDSLDVQLPPVDSKLFRRVDAITPMSWQLTAYRLALSLFPARYRFEILGAALFELDVPVPPFLAWAESGLRQHGASTRFFDARRSAGALGLRQVAAAAIARMAEAELDGLDVDAALRRRVELAGGVARGYAVSVELMRRWTEFVRDEIRRGALRPDREMVRMVQRKGRFAVGYHGKLKMGGRPFDDFMVDDPAGFVEALAHSPWVRPGSPEKSRLLTELVSFGGPMFRIFSEAEITVLRDWIASLPPELRRQTKPAANGADGSTHDGAPDLPPQIQAAPTGEPADGLASRVASPELNLRVRDLYYRLVNLEDHPEAVRDGLAFVRIWLGRSARDLERGAKGLPFQSYEHAHLRDWFEAQGRAQAASYVPKQGNITKTRDEVVAEAVQLCPMILIDGGWIQRWGNAGLVDTRVGAHLYKIFSDEIGNGDAALNHPNVYRRLMEQMGVEMLDHRSRAFATSDLFEDDAFLVPTFWLAISQFPRRFLPETLGLNLAMELSGVGGAYRDARDELRHYGFSTLFVDLHNTIDNVSTGHSALAVEAVEAHMDAVAKSGGRNALDAHWRRVWTGYRSLSAPAPSWKELFVRPSYPH